MKHSKRSLACDDINLTGHSNATRFMPFLDNIREKHGYTCSPVIQSISFKSLHYIPIITLLLYESSAVYRLYNGNKKKTNILSVSLK